MGASIFVKNSKGKGSVTNAQGEFTLSGVARNAILRVSFIGMKTEEVALNGRSELTITLQDEATKLEDVVVVGYGTHQLLGYRGYAVRHAPDGAYGLLRVRHADQ